MTLSYGTIIFKCCLKQKSSRNTSRENLKKTEIMKRLLFFDTDGTDGAVLAYGLIGDHKHAFVAPLIDDLVGR